MTLPRSPVRQEDGDALVIDGAAPRPSPVAAVAERAVAALVGAGVVTRSLDRHRAVAERIAAHALVAGLARRQAEEPRLVVDEHVAVVRRLAIAELPQLVLGGLESGVVAPDRDRALRARRIHPRQNAGRHPALAFAVARAVRPTPLGR